MGSYPRSLILGHRGSPLKATENTLRSFDLAAAQGADGVELDVRRSRDGVPVVIHDDSLGRTTGAHGQVSHLPWPAIERLTDALVPSLRQVAAWAAARRIWLNVELKSAGVEERVIETLADARLLEKTILSSFDPAPLRRAGEIEPTLARFYLTDRWDTEAERRFSWSGASGVCIRDDAATNQTVRAFARSEIPVIVWTVNDRPRIRQLLDERVAGIISDDVAAAVAERKVVEDG